jgi:hypothetical protein
MITAAIFALSAALLTGCNEYTQSLCQEAGMTDVAGFEGHFTGTASLPKFGQKDRPYGDLNVVRTGNGQYDVTLDAMVSADKKEKVAFKGSTCQIGGKTYLELTAAAAKSAEPKFTVFAIDWSQDKKVFDYLTFDAAKLTEAGAKVTKATPKDPSAYAISIFDNKGVKADAVIGAAKSLRELGVISIDFVRAN